MPSNMQGTLSTRVTNVMASTSVDWTISNLNEIYRNELIHDLKFVLKTTHTPNTICTWQFGLEPNENCISLYCKLHEIDGDLGTRKLYFQSTETDSTGNIHALSSKVLPTTVNERIEATIFFTVGIERFPLPQDGKLILKLKVYSVLPEYTEEHAKNDSNRETKRKLAYASLNILQNNMAKLLSDQESSDLQIITSDEEVLYGHKLILQTQNPVFASMLRSDLSEARSGIIKVEEICGKTMKIILHYLYTGELLPSWSDADVILEFTYAAGKYQLTEVLKMLDMLLGNELTEEHTSSLINLMSLANKLSLQNAEKRLLKEIQKKAVQAEFTE